ncbi:uncharacterized protein PSFLO_03142 [Pseudozyma flocculosa]|uniref:Uncharacterized protein n=1 Tax=Pseudozyma flocculosa TaxID=84751 RepID=A0A5C3F155_9BASI|nr:uncharacterized protein PSFLO_03142 [Pseudozyma flocculosa]
MEGQAAGRRAGKRASSERPDGGAASWGGRVLRRGSIKGRPDARPDARSGLRSRPSSSNAEPPGVIVQGRPRPGRASARSGLIAVVDLTTHLRKRVDASRMVRVSVLIRHAWFGSDPSGPG